MIKLESYLKSGPVDVEYISHVGPFQKTSKKGNTFAAYTYTFRLRSTGETFEQMLFDSDHRKIGYVGPNALIRIMAKGNGYLDYIVLPVGEASMNVPQPSNQKQVHLERKITEDVKNHEEQKAAEDAKWLRIDTSKIVFGYMNTEMAKGKTPKEARAVAIEAWKEQEGAVDEILAIHKKSDGEPKFAPELVHKPSVTIDEVNQAFGPSA